MAIKNTSFAKGEAVQKLIEVIARVNNKSVSDDATLQAAIDEVREMFKTDELTECTTAELNTFISGSQLEPGHKYKITDNDNIIVSAKSTSELESCAIGDLGIYEVINPHNAYLEEEPFNLGDFVQRLENIETDNDGTIIYNEPINLGDLDNEWHITIPAGEYYVLSENWTDIEHGGSGTRCLWANKNNPLGGIIYWCTHVPGMAGGFEAAGKSIYHAASLVPDFKQISFLTKEEFNDFVYNVAEGDTYTPLQKIILETVGEGDPNLIEIDAKEFALKIDNGGFKPGAVYKCDLVDVPKYIGGVESDIVDCMVAVMAISDNKLSPEMILIDGDNMFAVTGTISNPLGDTGPAYLEIESFTDGFGNRTNFYPKLYFPTATNFSRNNIIFSKINGHISAPTDFTCSATTVVGNTIISPSKFTVSATTVQANEVAIGAQVIISGAGTVGMNKFGAASNVSIIAAADCEVSMNIFGDRCSVSAGASQPLQLCQMNHVGFASTTVWELAAAGNTIEDNCSNIKLVYAMRNFFAVQCSNITLSGDVTNGPCMSNKFGYGCGANGAIVLGAGSGANIFGIQCNNCTLGINVTGCIFEGLNMVAVPAGFQMYTVKLGVGATGKVTLSQYKNYSGQGFRINVSHKVTGGLIYWTDEEALAGGTDNFIGTNTVTTVASIPVTKSTVLANLTAGGAVSFATGLAAGREVYAIAKNTGTDPITLTFTDANVESVELAAGARAEFSVISIAGTYYVRVGVDSAAGAAVEEISAEEVAAKFA